MADSRAGVRTKNPSTAFFLSLLVWPGSGNIYNGKFRHGFIWISSAVAGCMLYVVQLGVFAAALISIYIFATLHAYRQAKKINYFRTGSPEHVPEKPLQAGSDQWEPGSSGKSEEYLNTGRATDSEDKNPHR